MFLRPALSLSQIKTDVRAKLQPTVTYLQNSGEEYIDQVFKYAMWLFQKDQNIAFEVRSTSWLVLRIAPSLNLSLRRSLSLRMSNFLGPRSRTFSKPSTPGFVPDSSAEPSVSEMVIWLWTIFHRREQVVCPGVMTRFKGTATPIPCIYCLLRSCSSEVDPPVI